MSPARRLPRRRTSRTGSQLSTSTEPFSYLSVHCIRMLPAPHAERRTDSPLHTKVTSARVSRTAQQKSRHFPPFPYAALSPSIFSSQTAGSRKRQNNFVTFHYTSNAEHYAPRTCIERRRKEGREAKEGEETTSVYLLVAL
jgi:hypothetical protein